MHVSRVQRKRALAAKRAPMAIVDLASLPFRGAELAKVYEDIQAWLAGDQAGWADEVITLVIAENIHTNWPHTIEELAPRVEVERCADPESAAIRAAELAGTHALLIAAMPNENWERWAELYRGKGGRLALEPADALARAAAGQWPLRPMSSTSLSIRELTIADPNAVEERSAQRPPLRPWRPLSLALATGNEIAPFAGWSRVRRIAFAQQLGLEAAAWRRELVAEELAAFAAQLGAELTELDPGEFQLLMQHAQQRMVRDGLFRVDGDLQLVNWSERLPAEIETSANVHVHRIEAPEREFVRLQTALAAETSDLLIDDPTLDGLLDRLAVSGHDRLALAYARAGIAFYSDLNLSEPTSLPSLIGELRDAMTGEPIPKIAIMLPPGFVPPAVAQTKVAAWPFGPIWIGEAMAEPADLRGARLCESRKPRYAKLLRKGHHYLGPAIYSFPKIMNVARWFDACEALIADLPAQEPQLDATAEDDWCSDEHRLKAAAQAFCEYLWTALSHGLESGAYRSCVDGKVIVDLGPGVFATLLLRRSSRAGRARVVVRTAIGQHDSHFRIQTQRITRGAQGSSESGLELPSEMILEAGGVRATVTFSAAVSD